MRFCQGIPKKPRAGKTISRAKAQRRGESEGGRRKAGGGRREAEIRRWEKEGNKKQVLGPGPATAKRLGAKTGLEKAPMQDGQSAACPSILLLYPA